MKVNAATQATINDFFREHVDESYRTVMNAIRLSVEHTDEHRRAIFEVCNCLLKHNLPFWTEVRLKNGSIPDVVCPTHIRPFVEVLCTETPKMFNETKLVRYEPQFTSSDFIFVDAKVPFNDEMIF